MSAENVPVGGSTLFDSVGKSTGNVLLPYYFGELLGSVLAGENLVAHEEKIRLYVIDPGLPESGNRAENRTPALRSRAKSATLLVRINLPRARRPLCNWN